MRILSRLARMSLNLVALLAACQTLAPRPASRVAPGFALPDMPPLKPGICGRLDFEPLGESSGIIKSRLRDNLYWTHNDSGDEPRIFPVRRDGSIIKPNWAIQNNFDYQGVRIPDAVAIDWEDIATDDQGHLIIADTGNNANARRDLVLYVVSEPDPTEFIATRVLRPIPIRYPDQTAFPPEPGQRNFDCEAVFCARGHIYLLSKHRGDTHTKLYRLDRQHPFTPNTLTLLDEINIEGQVTAADASPDGRRLAVLTCKAVWVFESKSGQDNWLRGDARWAPIEAGQCEAICFDNEDTLLLTNEERGVMELSLSALVPVARR